MKSMVNIFLQRSGITYKYVEPDFQSDLRKDYFKFLFFKLKRLESLN